MTYKYMQVDVEESKRLAEIYNELPTYQDIYRERVEVLEKAKAFDRLLEIYEEAIEENALEEDLLDDMSDVIDEYRERNEDTDND